MSELLYNVDAVRTYCGVAENIHRNETLSPELEENGTVKMMRLGYANGGKEAAINIAYVALMMHTESLSSLLATDDGRMIEYVGIDNAKGSSKAMKGLLWPKLPDEARKVYQAMLSGDYLVGQTSSNTGGLHPYGRGQYDYVTLGATNENIYGFRGEGNLLTVAPPGSGKGQCHVIPNLIEYPGSVFVLDVKGENYRYTAKHRYHKYGKGVTRFAPDDPENSASYNPLYWLNQDPENIYTSAQQLAEMLMVPDKKDHWQDRAQAMITAIIVYVVLNAKAENQHLPYVAELLYGSEEELQNLWNKMLAYRDVAEDNPAAWRLGLFANDMLGSAKGNAKEASSVITTARRSMEIWLSPKIKRLTTGQSKNWDPKELITCPAASEHFTRVMAGGAEPADPIGTAESIYIEVGVGEIEMMASVLRVIIGQHIYMSIKQCQEWERMGNEDPNAKPPIAPVLFMLDEFPQLGYMKPLEDAFDVARAYKIRLWVFAQNLKQIEKHYGKSSDIILGACNIKAFMNVDENLTAQYVSSRMGEKKASAFGGSREKVAGIAEIQGPDYADKVIVFHRGDDPIILNKYPAYNDDHCRKIMNGEIDYG